MLAGLVGAAVIIGPDALADLGVDVAAQLACLAAAVSYAVAGIYGRRFRRLGVPPLTTATGQVSASSLLLLPAVVLIDRPWELAMPGIEVWGAVLGVAALSTALAYVLYFRILATAGATNLLLVTFLIPVSAILLGTLFLGERLEPQAFAGMALIAAGLAAIDGRPVHLLRRSATGHGGEHVDRASGDERRVEAGALALDEDIDVTADARPAVAQPVTHAGPAEVQRIHHAVDVGGVEFDLENGTGKQPHKRGR